MKEENLLTAKDLTFRYFEQSKKPVLDHISLELPRGSVTLLTGDSGCGKSTLASTLAGLFPKNGGFLQNGTVEVSGKSVPEMPENERVRHLSMMFQNCDLQFCMDTLREELRFCLENIAEKPAEMDARSLRAARQTGMETHLDRPLHTLSGGEKQKAALTCILALESSCLILDEPFANLDPSSTNELLMLLQKVQRERNLTILAIDHQWQRWEGFASRIARLEGNDTLRMITEPVHRDFSPSNGRVLSPARPCLADSNDSLFLLSNVTLYPGNSKKISPSQKPLLNQALASFPAGSITALLGGSGTGKTTLFEAMLGLHPYEGSILFQGKELRHYQKKELYIKAGIVFQNPSNQFVTQGVLDEILFSLRRSDKKATLRQLEEKALTLLARFQLNSARSRSPFMLSQGQQRRLAVLSMLANDQQVLLLDEPTYGQDDYSAEAIMDLLEELVQEQHLTVILSTHDEELAFRRANRIYRLQSEKLELVQKNTANGEESA